MVVPQYIDRRVDSLGRVTLPVGLRKRMQIEEGMDLEVYTFIEKGREYIALAKPLPKDSSPQMDEASE